MSVAMAGHVDYTLSLDAPAVSGESVSFTVTRSQPYSGTEWVKLTCDGGVQLNPLSSLSNNVDFPVIWGTPDSLTGYVTFEAVYGTTCTATLTETPWRLKRNDISITFQVN